MNNFSIMITTLVLMISFSSCKKTGESKIAPEVTILAPMMGQVFQAGDTIYFQGTASDNEDLHEGKLEIIKTADNSALASKNEYVHATKSYTFDGRFSVPVTSETNAIARATYEDHDGNQTVKEVAITLKP